uniref:Ribonuclease A-domain domain-containing protein n=1 Tax=Xiphophorus maculatus TaxID=8083 RepID=A0A3B5PRN7_XIPMA
MAFISVIILRGVTKVPSLCDSCPTPTERYQNFLRQHVIDAMDENDCTRVIAVRNIADEDKPKEKNTFIIAGEEAVRAICQGKPGKRKSKNKFTVILCTYTGENNYKGRRSVLFLEAECEKVGEQFLPVHFIKQFRGKGRR